DVESSGSFELEFPVDEDGELSPIDVSVSVQAPDFSPPFQSKKMRVKPEGDSGPRVLFVTPKRAGNLLVNVELILDESVIASCVFSTRASAEGGGEPSAQLRSVDLGSGPAAVPDPEIDTTLGSGESPNEGPAQSTWSSSKMKRLPSVIQKSGSSDSFTFGSGTKSAMGSTIRIAAGLMIFGFVSFATYLGISEFKTAATIASTELNQPERLAVENVEKIVAAQKIFAANNPEKRFGTIEELKNAGLIDETMVDPEKGGYAINVTLKDSGNAFDVVAEPVKPKVVAISARKVFSTEKREVFLKDRKEVVTRDQPGLLLTKDK
ncbi:MAG: hypothetical protein OEM82_07365, partial [Acidobacteriota bacterium]|nr:hypothetical protein [Acidobacteriota bacterium]